MKKNMYKIFIMCVPFVLFAHDTFAQLKAPNSHGLVHNYSLLGVLEGVIMWVLGIVGSLAVLMIVASGVMYITANGDSGRIDKAKDTLVYAITGLVVALLGYVIVLFIGNALGANS